jgi:hypothetical protein
MENKGVQCGGRSVPKMLSLKMNMNCIIPLCQRGVKRHVNFSVLSCGSGRQHTLLCR